MTTTRIRGGDSSSRLTTEWVEIVEPRSRDHMFANLTTGECVWQPPPGVPVKKATDDQWWELFDATTSRFYYYNAATQTNVWRRPGPDCDIIPLAKLQTLKQNTQVNESPRSSSSVSCQSGGGGHGLDRLPLPRRRPRVVTSTSAQTSPSPDPKRMRLPHPHRIRPLRLESDRKLSRQRSLDQFEGAAGQMARSVSFMGGRREEAAASSYDKFFGASGWTPAASVSASNGRVKTPSVLDLVDSGNSLIEEEDEVPLRRLRRPSKQQPYLPEFEAYVSEMKGHCYESNLESEDDDCSSSCHGDDEDESDDRLSLDQRQRSCFGSGSVPPPIPPHRHLPPPKLPPPAVTPKFPNEVDAFSQDFDLRLSLASSSTASSTMPRNGNQLTAAAPSYDVVHHSSLQRNAHSLLVGGGGSVGGRDVLSTGASRLSLDQGRGSVVVGRRNHRSSFERYAEGNLSVQKKGLFRKRMKLKDVLSWTDEAIGKPLTRLADKTGKKEALEVFKLIQTYMGDRKAKQRMTVDSVALDVIDAGFTNCHLRDEIFVQLCKQTWDNPKIESLRRGWELLAVCLAFFPPTDDYGPCLHSYIGLHTDRKVGNFPGPVRINEYAGVCARRLARIVAAGRLGPRKPTVDDVRQSRSQILNPSVFGGTLDEVMELQRHRFPGLRLPWILSALTAQILELNGLVTEGIFRVPADQEEVNLTKVRFENWEAASCSDCHTASSLLKLWLRELYEPLIPDAFYEDAIDLGARMECGSATASDLYNLTLSLPELNCLTITYLVRYLQRFSTDAVSKVTKMDAANLATMFAPNFLRCPFHDPLVILDNARKEMTFVKNLILFLDTLSVEGIV